eukprot:TRINITY_DN1379_c0_g1_i3.p1 TRINITY_DN1379_c0_g1~~TRINITY_DN1379_c0_g1_i3.p1  ORF type:complete len:342 (-),score=53.12 TRINITY_DN1379_c0_g1_i3:8-1033(-)
MVNICLADSIWQSAFRSDFVLSASSSDDIAHSYRNHRKGSNLPAATFWWHAYRRTKRQFNIATSENMVQAFHYFLDHKLCNGSNVAAFMWMVINHGMTFNLYYFVIDSFDDLNDGSDSSKSEEDELNESFMRPFVAYFDLRGLTFTNALRAFAAIFGPILDSHLRRSWSILAEKYMQDNRGREDLIADFRRYDHFRDSTIPTALNNTVLDTLSREKDHQELIWGSRIAWADRTQLWDILRVDGQLCECILDRRKMMMSMKAGDGNVRTISLKNPSRNGRAIQTICAKTLLEVKTVDGFNHIEGEPHQIKRWYHCIQYILCTQDIVPTCKDASDLLKIGNVS